MTKRIITIQGSSEINKVEQMKICGGYNSKPTCDEQNFCREKGTCCSNGFCIPEVDKQGNYMFCDY
jgi:hypothetical protein